MAGNPRKSNPPLITRKMGNRNGISVELREPVSRMSVLGAIRGQKRIFHGLDKKILILHNYKVFHPDHPLNFLQRSF